MPDGGPDIGGLTLRLQEFGLSVRGGFVLEEGDIDAPRHRAGPVRSVLMVGHFGSSIWPSFRRWHLAHSHEADPLDNWSKEVLGRIAADHSAVAVFPSDKPFMPFQRWAMRAEGISQSPLGMLIHPVYGLWHAFRGALLFRDPIDIEPATKQAHPCATCRAKPCLSACPVSAFDGANFAVDRCRDHLRQKHQACMMGGCLARLACPVGDGYEYVPEQQAFHMRAFAG
jgi:hypothetical protein